MLLEKYDTEKNNTRTAAFVKRSERAAKISHNLFQRLQNTDLSACGFKSFVKFKLQGECSLSLQSVVHIVFTMVLLFSSRSLK